jgi:hypothetical protein
LVLEALLAHKLQRQEAGEFPQLLVVLHLHFNLQALYLLVGEAGVLGHPQERITMGLMEVLVVVEMVTGQVRVELVIPQSHLHLKEMMAVTV